jgi:hypothetical protein
METYMHLDRSALIDLYPSALSDVGPFDSFRLHYEALTACDIPQSAAVGLDFRRYAVIPLISEDQRRLKSRRLNPEHFGLTPKKISTGAPMLPEIRPSL